MAQHFIFGLIGAEDIDIGGGTFSVTLPDGTTVPDYHQVGSQTFFDGVRNPLQNGCVGNGVIDDRAALNTLANATLQPNGGTIFFGGPATYRISSNLTFPANVDLRFSKGSKLSIDTGVTATINGNISSGLYQIFSGLGSVSIGASAPVEVCHPVWWGAAEDGATDDTVPLQSAVSQGKSVFLRSTYKVTNALHFNTKGQLIYGSGRTVSKFIVQSDFNLAATGVLVAGSGEAGPVFKDFGVEFAQPDTAVRANLVSYPVAFYLVDTPRFKIEDVRIVAAMNGIDMKGNSGGAVINGLEMSWFGTGIDIDGSLDLVRIQQAHLWPFGLTANQSVIYDDSSTVGIQSGRCDGLILDEYFADCGGWQLKLVLTGNGHTFGSGSNCTFDTFKGVYMEYGNYSLSNPNFTAGYAQSQAIKMTGGFLRVTNPNLEVHANITDPYVSLSGVGSPSSGHLQIMNSTVSFPGDVIMFEAKASSGNTTFELIGAMITAPINTSPSNPIISIAAGARAIIDDIRMTDKGSGTGNVLTIATDDQHYVGFIADEGWGISLPASATTLAAPFGPWLTYTPTVSASAGTLTSASATGRYLLKKHSVDVEIVITITTNGPASTILQAILPVTPAANEVIPGIDASALLTLMASVNTGNPLLSIVKYDGTYPGANGKVLRIAGSYET